MAGSIFNVTSWLSNKLKRPVKTLPAVEASDVAETVGEGKFVGATSDDLLLFEVKPQICVDSKDLFS